MKTISRFFASGSWGKYFASLGEFSTAPYDVFEVENAFIRFACEKEKGFFSAFVTKISFLGGI
jgi:hypothetical protein